MKREDTKWQAERDVWWQVCVSLLNGNLLYTLLILYFKACAQLLFCFSRVGCRPFISVTLWGSFPIFLLNILMCSSPACLRKKKTCAQLLRITLLFLYKFLRNIFQDVVTKFPTKCDVEWVDAEDSLFLLYTSGSTGKPKVLLTELDLAVIALAKILISQLMQGVLHTSGGYMLYTATTFKYAFDYKPTDIYW